MNSRSKLGFAIACGLLLVVVGGGVVMRKWLRRHDDPSAVSSPAAASSARVPIPLDIAELLYDGKLGEGWQDWGWGPHRLGNGPAQVVFQGYGGILFHHQSHSESYGGVTFRFQAPAAWGTFMHVSLRGTGAPDSAFPLVSLEPRHIAPLEAGWREVLVDWKELNPQRLPFDRVMIGSAKAVGADWVLLDRVALTKEGGGGAAAPSQRDDALRVICDAASHPLNELIYGNSAESWESGQSAIRMGGNPMSRFNWELTTWNSASDWFFENVVAG